MPAMDFCNTMEFPLATLWIFNLQLSVFLSYNKQRLIIAQRSGTCKPGADKANR